MSAGCDSHERLSLGAYVLGALDPVERAEVEAHVSECVPCRDELAELAAMPGLLSRIRLEDVLEPPAPPSPASTERLLGRLRAARRAKRRRVTAAVGAIAAAAVAIGVVAIAGDTGDGGSPAQVASISARSPQTGVSATFGLRPASWGTAVRVRLHGVRPGTRCRLIAIARDGQREVAGTWRATYDGTADVETATAISKDRLASLEVVTAAGRRLVRAAQQPVSAPSS